MKKRPKHKKPHPWKDAAGAGERRAKAKHRGVLTPQQITYVVNRLKRYDNE